MSDATFDYIEAPFDDVAEEQLPKEGNYPLLIKSVEKQVSETNRQMVRCYIEIESTDEQGRPYQGIFHYLVFPNADDWSEDKEKAQGFIRRVKRFCHAFKIDMSGSKFDPNVLAGARGQCLVSLEDYNGEMQPRLKLPRIK